VPSGVAADSSVALQFGKLYRNRPKNLKREM